MSKAVMLSIQPKWCELIASGKKTIEVRKSRPSIETPFKCYIYCTKHSERLIEVMKYGDDCYGTTYHGEPVFIKTYKDFTPYFVGREQKVIGEFVCDKTLTLDCDKAIEANKYGTYSVWDADNEKWIDWDIDASCVPTADLIKYLDGKSASFWHISDLVIYDKPRELGEFKKACKHSDCRFCPHVIADEQFPFGVYPIDCGLPSLTRPFQSWGYVEEV